MSKSKKAVSEIPSTTEALIESLLNGGPRQSTNARSTLHSRACENEDLAALLPDPITVEDPIRKLAVVTLLMICHANEDRFEEFFAVSQHKKLENRMLDWGNWVSHRAPQFIDRLVPTIVENLASGDSERVKAAAYPVSRMRVTWAWSDQLLPLIGVHQNVVIGLANAYMNSVEKPSLDMVLELLSSKDAKVRSGAAELISHIAIREASLSDVCTLVSHANASVRKGACIAITYSLRAFLASTSSNGYQGKRGGDFMALTVSMKDRKGREAVASAVTAGMEHGFKVTPEVRATKKLLQSKNPNERTEGAMRAHNLSLDVHDCRQLATLVAQALFDEESAVCEAAARAMYVIADMQSPVYVVQASLPCIQVALSQSDGDAESNLKSACRALERSMSKMG